VALLDQWQYGNHKRIIHQKAPQSYAVEVFYSNSTRKNHQANTEETCLTL